MLRPLTVTSISTAAVKTTLFMLFPGHFQAFLTPEPVNPFDSDPAIPVSWMLDMQSQQVFDYRLISIKLFEFISLDTS